MFTWKNIVHMMVNSKQQLLVSDILGFRTLSIVLVIKNTAKIVKKKQSESYSNYLTAISDIYLVSISVNFVSESQITQPPFVLVGQVAIERN
jgi:hypothetical protein